jgi:hypothetical protein
MAEIIPGFDWNQTKEMYDMCACVPVCDTSIRAQSL